MDNISYLLQRIFRSISTELLINAFGKSVNIGYVDNRSLEELIIQAVIMDNFLVDLNLIGGQTVLIPLDQPGINVTSLSNATTYHIPLSATQGRKIQSAYGLRFRDGRTSGGASVLGGVPSVPNDGHDTSMARALAGNMAPRVTGIGNAELIAPNTVLIPGPMQSGSLSLEVVLANDSQLANLNPRSMTKLAAAAVLLAKAIVHTRLNIRMGEGSIIPGSINGALRSELDNMADAEELYNEMLDGVLRNITMQNDPVARQIYTKNFLYN